MLENGDAICRGISAKVGNPSKDWQLFQSFNVKDAHVGVHAKHQRRRIHASLLITIRCVIDGRHSAQYTNGLLLNLLVSFLLYDHSLKK